MAGIGDTLKTAWSGPGRKWLLVGAVGAGAYLWWTRGRSGASVAAGADTGVAVTPGGAAVGEPLTPPGGDYTDPLSPTTRPSTNAEWLAEAVAKLILPPNSYEPASAWNALNKALAGSPISQAEANIVNAALTIAGTPPEGMPQLNITAPTPPGGGGGGTTPTPVSHTVRSGETLTSIGAGWGTTSSRVYARNAAAIEAAARSHGRTSSRGGPTNSLGWWIYPGTVLYKP